MMSAVRAQSASLGEGGTRSVPAPAPKALAVLRSVQSREKLARATANRMEITWFDSRREAETALRSAHFDVVFAESSDAHGLPTSTLVATLTSRRAATVVIGLFSLGKALSEPDYNLLRAGVHHAVSLEDLDTTRLLRAALTAATKASLLNRVWRHLDSQLEPDVRDFVRCGLLSDRGRSVSDAARALGVHRKTVWRRFRNAGYPPPRELLHWCHLLRASCAIEGSTRSVNSVADELEFCSPSGLRNLTSSYLRCRPSALRAHGGVDRVLRAFVARFGASARPSVGEDASASRELQRGHIGSTARSGALLVAPLGAVTSSPHPSAAQTQVASPAGPSSRRCLVPSTGRTAHASAVD